MPVEYQQLEYIQTSGTQYIDTGYIPSSNTSIEMKASNNATTNTTLYCARGTSGYQDKTYTAFLINGTSFRVDYYNSVQYENQMTAAKDTVYVYKQKKNVVYVDGNLVKTLNQTEFSSAYNMYLLASHRGGSEIGNIGNVKLYYCKIWDGETLVRDYIPVLDKDGVACLYDKVKGKYYYNQGSGTFYTNK